ncbi:hypothetical protein [Flavilitoribacter nigricans]|uniref:Uncharacterized protein n=1 Tax=Flavilitoribacter nigricans (strain ATCC 23147 / DSM 23189 / NBRC 102662 / NCIMB 1420 / SS-2) TaxID=1122177 RepID=A0A2D0N5W8_FLAN2|nr:hypothetical protein [Flavilitoribacter nigricans]PHN03901.1 hypothetical protein CRP01_23805 [Flavilitoribacter nigricans DSM 23189 = NBRC 102662]
MTNQPEEQYKPAEKLELGAIETQAFPKVFKKVSCPSCEEEVQANNLNLQNSMAKCGSCNAIFSIEEEVASVKVQKDMKQEFIRPEGVDLFYFKDDLDITVQQHIQGLDAFGIFFAPMSAIFALLIYVAKGISVLYPVFFAIITLYFLYRVLNYSRNKTYIDINSKYLSIRSRPKNFKKDRTYAANEIDQLYLKHSGDGMGYYTIHMIVNGVEGQTHEKLLTLNTLSKAKYVEQEIERYLNIEDRAVPEANV